ncbi:MAG: hypothetical protein GY876_10560 [Planctomycetes bacterium]|nr:hypothetical protein [Planctomycetota bacterium]
MTRTNANVSDLLLNLIDGVGVLSDLDASDDVHLTPNESFLLEGMREAIADAMLHAAREAADDDS